MTIQVEIKDRVAYLTLDRPRALNALNEQMSQALVTKAIELDQDPNIGCLVIRGSAKVFCAGADIRELAGWQWPENLEKDHFSLWDRFADLSVPKIAAVSGIALGGGCELALMCDFIYASQDAKFGQPELNLGLIPGMGGTQRLVKRVGRARAKEMILTGEAISADEALQVGLVNRVLPPNELHKYVHACSAKIARHPRTASRTASAMLDKAEELSLREGLQYERARYFALWGTADAQEGMQAFIEKRVAKFN